MSQMTCCVIYGSGWDLSKINFLTFSQQVIIFGNRERKLSDLIEKACCQFFSYFAVFLSRQIQVLAFAVLEL